MTQSGGVTIHRLPNRPGTKGGGGRTVQQVKSSWIRRPHRLPPPPPLTFTIHPQSAALSPSDHPSRTQNTLCCSEISYQLFTVSMRNSTLCSAERHVHPNTHVLDYFFSLDSVTSLLLLVFEYPCFNWSD